jgi:Domain of unknown function (DUF4340)
MNKSTLIALAVFGVLGLAWVATREPQVNVGMHKATFSPVAADSITSIEVGGPNPVSLRLENGAWTVGAGAAEKRYPADEAQVKGLTQALADLKADDFVTERAEKHAELEVDPAKGLSVQASSATGVVREFTLGKASKSGGAYLRAGNSNEVYVTIGGLPYQVRRNVTAWRKKSITTAKADDVTALSVSLENGARFGLKLEGTAFTLEPGAVGKDFKFDPVAAQRLVGQLTSLSAQEFGDDAAEVVPNVFELSTKDGKKVSVRLGAKHPDGTFPARVDGDAQTYLLPGYQAEVLLKGIEGLRDMRLLRVDEVALVERLTVSAGGKKTVAQKDGGSWKIVEPKSLPAGFDFDASQVDRQVSVLTNLRGLKVVRDVPEANVGVSAVTVAVELKGGAIKHVAFGSATSTASEVYAKADDGMLYAAPASDKAQFERGLELFKRPPPPPSFNGMQGIQGLEQLPPEVRKQLEAQLRAQQH